MKSPSTLIAILNKAILVQENIEKAEQNVKDHIEQVKFYQSIYNHEMVYHYTKRIDSNKAIAKRLTAYYSHLIERATPSPTIQVFIEEESFSCHVMD